MHENHAVVPPPPPTPLLLCVGSFSRKLAAGSDCEACGGLWSICGSRGAAAGVSPPLARSRHGPQVSHTGGASEGETEVWDGGRKFGGGGILVSHSLLPPLRWNGSTGRALSAHCCRQAQEKMPQLIHAEPWSRSRASTADGRVGGTRLRRRENYCLTCTPAASEN